MNELDFYDIDAHLERVLTEAETIEGIFAKESERGLFIRRAEMLRGLVRRRHEAGKNVSELTRGELIQRLFADLTPGSLRTQLSRFRGHLEKVGCAGPGRFLLAIPDARGAGAEAARCRFEGDSMSQRRLAQGTRDAISAIKREDKIVPPRGWPDVPRFFISFAWADRDLVNVFLEELRLMLRGIGVSNFEFWKCDDYRQTDSGIPVGSHIEQEITRAMKRCPFALLLLSPAYCESGIINRLERPYYFGPEAKGIGLPVGVGAYRPDFKHVNCPGFSEGLVYFLPRTKGDQHDLSYIDLRRNDRRREQFIRGLAERIQALLAQHHPVDPITPATPHPVRADSSEFDALPAELLDAANFYDPARGKFIPQRADKQRTLAKAAEVELADGESGVDLLAELTAWLTDEKGAAYCALLGETGSGKTMACLELCRELLEKRESASSLPVPIYLDLRLVNQDGLLASNPEARPLLSDILTAMVRRSALTMPSPATILRAVQTQGALLVWDGLDEVLVHLSEQAGEAFFAELRKALPVEMAGQPGAGRLLFACRTQYFRGMAHEVSLFTESRKSAINPSAGGKEDRNPPHARYLVLRVLPFGEEQIRAYLQANVPGVDLDRALEIIDSVHNLRELAGRPFLLSLMRPFLARLDHQLATGRSVRSVDLYAGFVQEWQERNAKMDRIISDDKPHLMQRLAAHLWREGMKSISCEALNRWLRKEIVSEPVWVHTYGEALKSHPEALLEHFRDATFLGRWDGEAFRFAHTSLQEYFLACHLVEALEAGKVEAWALPLPSRETFDFMVELRQQRAEESPVAERRMEAALAGILREVAEAETPIDATSWSPGFSRNESPQAKRKLSALAFWLRSHQPGQPEQPIPGMDLSGLDLTAWLFAPRGGPWGGKVPDVAPPVRLGMSGWLARGTALLRAGFGGVDLSGADFAGADLRTVEFQHCLLGGVTWPEPPPSGLLVRGGSGPAPVAPWLRFIDPVHPPSRPFVPFTATWPARTFTGHEGMVLSCAFSADGRRIVSGAGDNSVRVWDAVTGRLLRTITGHQNWVTSCAFSADGRRIVSGSWDKNVRIWEAETGQLLCTLTGHEKSVWSCAFSADGRRIVSGAGDNTVRIWDAETGLLLRTITGHEDRVWSCEFSADGRRIVSGAGDKTVRVWDAKTGHLLRTLSGHQGLVTSCAFSADGRLVLSGSWDNTVRVWETETGQLLRVLTGHEDGALSCKFSADGRRIVSGAGDNSVRIWDAETGRLLRTLAGHANWVWSCAFSADGRCIASGSWDNTLRVWDTGTGQLLRILTGHENGIWCCAFSADRRYIVSGANDNTVRIWEAETGRLRRTLTGHENRVWSCAFSADGRRIVSGAGDNTVRVWDAETGRLLRTLTGHEEWVTFCAFSADGRRIVSSSEDNTLRVWNTETGAALEPAAKDRAILQRKGRVSGLEITPVRTLRLSSATGTFLREICQLNDGDWAVLEPWNRELDAIRIPENVPVVIRRATPGAWRWLGYDARDEKGLYVPGAPVLEAEAFGPLPPA